MILSRKQQEKLLRFGYRARIWALFHLNPNQFFTVEEISEITGLKSSTVEQGLKFIRHLPFIETRVKYEMNEKIVHYGFVPV